jgi:cell fate regulator YaaT (PSP1 superfamily)
MIGRELYEVRVRPGRTSVFCHVTDESVTLNDWVVVDINGERECGRVIRGPVEIEDVEKLKEDFGTVQRKASAEDLDKLHKNQDMETKAYKVCREKILERKLPMKLVTVDALFDQSKIKFYFTADGRVDFRDLVRDLAHVYKTRIEMRQIGVRDEAKITGGIGVCGLTLCCNTWMRQFMPITIKMAKEQNLSLNPQKISGQCGRLLCCLSYEVDVYKQEKKNYPKIGKPIMTPEGKGMVQQFNILKGTVVVRLEDKVEEFKLEELKGVLDGKPLEAPPPTQYEETAEPEDLVEEEEFDEEDDDLLDEDDEDEDDDDDEYDEGEDDDFDEEDDDEEIDENGEEEIEDKRGDSSRK